MKLLAFLLAAFFTATRAHAAPVPLFDGKTLDGWESREPSLWKVEDGCLTGGDEQRKIPHNDFLCTKRSFSNFELRLKIKLTGDPKTGLINSGIQIRTQRNAAGHEVCGYQCDYGEPGWYGGIYDEGRRNKFIAPADMAVLHPAIKVWGWNEYVIRAEGDRIRTWINGVQGVDYREQNPNIPHDGILGIQLHAGGNTKVQVKDVLIEELPPTPDAPTWEKLGGVEGVRAKLAPPKKAAAAKDSDARENAGAGVKPMKPGNMPGSLPNSPDEERATFTLPAGFEVELIAAESDGIGKFVPLAFDQHGALWTTTAFEYPVDGNENPGAADALFASKAKDKVLVFDRDPKSPTGYAGKPRVFAEGLAIPLGVLPYKNGCYVQHGHDIAFLEDTDGDGKADKRTVILTGFGVQDSHLFPHQFTRAPGGWIWMAQGAFNYGKVRRPDEPAEKALQFDQCRMAKFRPDGSGFDITSNGPCNIWGLVLNGEGEAFIQEANDYGYPVMPFHEYANYPGCSNRQWKSYAPEFPGTAPDFRMGGTGLSGLALTDKNGPFPEPWRDVMLVANPITNRVQGIKMHRDGPYWKLDKPVDFLVSSDPWFRPVAITIGPDGCLYIVDWYNKIISHNEVPRNHPDRDKTRGRIWRVKPTGAKPFDVPDFTKLSGDDLIAKLGGDSLAQSHLAWQAIEDRGLSGIGAKLRDIAANAKLASSRRIAALWAFERCKGNPEAEANVPTTYALLKDGDPNVRREAVRALTNDIFAGVFTEPEIAGLRAETDPNVRRELIRGIATMIAIIEADQRAPVEDPNWPKVMQLQLQSQLMVNLLSFAREPLATPTAPSTQNGKPIKVREAYDREFERYLVRMFLEKYPEAVAKFLDSDDAKAAPVEARLLASLALEPKTSAARVAKLLPQLQRAPGQEEVLRLAQFPDEPGVGDALRAILSDPKTGAASLETLLAVKTRLDPRKLAPILAGAATTLLASNDASSLDLGIRLAGAFQLTDVENVLVSFLKRERPLPAGNSVATPGSTQASGKDAGGGTLEARAPVSVRVIRALSEIGSSRSDVFAELAESSPDALLRDEALNALAASKAADAPARVIALYPKLAPAQRRTALERLSATKPGATAIVTALSDAKLATSDLEASALDRLQAVLGANDPALAKLVDKLGTLFRPVLSLDGSDNAWSQTNVTLDGPCTIEAWVRLDPEKRKISNADGIAGAPGQLDFNFAGETPRIYVFPPLGDVAVAKKPITPGLWTHIAAARDATGIWRIYMDGELSVTGTEPGPNRIENVRIAWTSAKGGTRGAVSEVRFWNRERTADEIRAASDRRLPAGTPGLVFTSASGDWGRLQSGAKVIKTSDFPPVLTAEEATALDAKFSKYRALANQPGDAVRGKQVAALCMSCHLINGAGGNIGPNISGAGAMGQEALLRRLITPNASMESAYHVFRVTTRDGGIREGFFVRDEKEAVILRNPGADDQRIARRDIAGTKFLRRGMMPEGLLDAMTSQQVSDLFAYLMTLK